MPLLKSSSSGGVLHEMFFIPSTKLYGHTKSCMFRFDGWGEKTKTRFSPPPTWIFVFFFCSFARRFSAEKAREQSAAKAAPRWG